jgi:hypothetical protein
VKKFRVFSLVLLTTGLLLIFSMAPAQEQGKERIKTANPITLKGQEPTARQEAAPQTVGQEKILPKQEESKLTEQAKGQKQAEQNQVTKEAPKTTEDADAQKKPMTLEDFEKYLEDYGEWIETEDYGRIWVPSANKEKDWAPYRKGIWEDYESDCYLWRSLEPFGSIVYHYGRWHYHHILGWYWIPGYVWGPAWVNWYWWGGYACWSPMWYDYRYYNRYYGRYYGHSNSVGWSVVRKDQLKSPRLSHAIKSATQKASPIQINNAQLKPNAVPGRSAKLNTARSFSSNASISRPRPATANRATAQNRLANTPQSGRTRTQKYVGGLADSPWRSDPRAKAQPSNTTPSRPVFRPANQSRYYSPRMSSPTRSSTPRSSARPTAVHSSGTRSSAARTSAPRASSSRGGVVRRK